MQYTIMVYFNDEMVLSTRTHKIRRFLKILRGIKWQDEGVIAKLKVLYGKDFDNWGDLVVFDNEGIFSDSTKMWSAFIAFTEEGVNL